MKDFTTEFDTELQKIDIDDLDVSFFDNEYASYLLPWIGVDYGKYNHKKLLLVGESHHIKIDEDDYKEYCNAQDWYHEKHSYINREYQEEELNYSCNTRYLIGSNKWNGPSGIYKNPRKLIAEVLNEKYDADNSSKYMRPIAYCNYFQRPAFNGKSIRTQCCGIDRTKSYSIFTEIIKVLKPDYIYFLSKFAYDTFIGSGGGNSFICDFSPHPQWHHWHMYGKEKFKAFLIDNEIFSKQQ